MDSLIAFFALTYVVTWACFLTAGALARGEMTALAALRMPLLLIGSFAPSLTAILLTARASGRSGVGELLGRLKIWRVGIPWYAFALGFMACVKGVVALVHRVATGEWPTFGHESWYSILVAIVLAGIVGGPLGEEIGWRGYALPRLADRFGLATGSVLLGVLWGCWHLPIFFIPGLEQFGQSIPTYLLQVVALSVAMAWLYGHSRGSLLLAVLMHSAINQTKDLVPSAVVGATNPWALSPSRVAWLTVGILWIAAAFFLVRMPGAHARR
ncbi:MAG: CPBP family intramembrane glutamic endopeptidase [Gemmatimonadaceae bacterium]